MAQRHDMHTIIPERTTAPVARMKFVDPDTTADGQARAHVTFNRLETLWVNTGTQCNITCTNCYIESSPSNDRLSYLTADELAPFLDEVDALNARPIEIGFTGGEPFLNPEAPDLIEMALTRGHRALVLTNAMKPMRRPRVERALLDLRGQYGARLSLRVSLDSHDRALHDQERGEGAFDAALEGLVWLAREGFDISVAGRRGFAESEDAARAGFAALFARNAIAIDAHDPARLVLFPEMQPARDAPEITHACWGILDKSPNDMMCASSRMIVKRKGAARPSVISCTLLPYTPEFEMGATLAESLTPVRLNHPFCAQFCVLGGASCST